MISRPKSNFCPSWQRRVNFGSEIAESGGSLSSSLNNSAPLAKMERYLWVPKSKSERALKIDWPSFGTCSEMKVQQFFTYAKSQLSFLTARE